MSLRHRLSEEIVLELHRQNLTQVELAHRAEISQKHLSRLLTNQDVGSMDLWDQLAECLGQRWSLALGNALTAGRDGAE